ncbi:hypothetical protein [Sphingomonas sanxanigenens]|uniref:hypothetical protein n=1 Tax=Sphingomonas sanxanigenens TaxID=397260 RepID=UPI0004B87E35|nr:hypothetical protein [Sphingomonas sanxanigenens]
MTRSLDDFAITRRWPAQHPDRLQLYSLPTPNGVKVCAPCQGGAFQWVKAPPGNMLQPEATGAGMEVTKCLKPPDDGHIGDRASVQAAT